MSSGSPTWCERLYEARAGELILYGRALGLSHGEAEDVLQETFVALLERTEAPEQPQHYGVRAYRNRALNPSNQSVTLWAAGDSQTRQNVADVRRFEWTTATRIPSSMPSFVQFGTNGLMR